MTAKVGSKAALESVARCLPSRVQLLPSAPALVLRRQAKDIQSQRPTESPRAHPVVLDVGSDSLEEVERRHEEVGRGSRKGG